MREALIKYFATKWGTSFEGGALSSIGALLSKYNILKGLICHILILVIKKIKIIETNIFKFFDAFILDKSLYYILNFNRLFTLVVR